MSRLLLLLLAIPALAHAAGATLSATRPTTNTDGSALAASDIAGYQWSCQFTPTGGTAAACTGFTGGTVTGSSPSATVTFTAPAIGGNACFQVVAKHVAGTTSAKSDLTATSCKAIAPLVPSAPTDVTVTITVAITLSSDSPISVAMAAPVVTSKVTSKP